ncbi:MAG: HPr family phosphocarrier protein [Candidatus Omnitrophota bacterium]
MSSESKISEISTTRHQEAYRESIALLKSLIAGPENNSIGFFASSAQKDNYKRLFARDAFWICMASILSEEEDLLRACEDSFATLSANQREDGAIPSNVSPEGRVSYGIINPRVDPTTLFIIGCGRFGKRYPERDIIEKYLKPVKKAIEYLENNWENKDLGLLYIPRAGNWADEYLQQGFVLYDEVLWHMALNEFADILEKAGEPGPGKYREKAAKVKNIIREKFWIKNLDRTKEDIYRRVSGKFDFEKVGYFIHFYYSPDLSSSDFGHPCGIFDAFGNILALLAGIPTGEQARDILNFIDEISVNKYPLVPAHYPFFPEETFKSLRLHQFRFKEYVGHFHNGGLWSWYTGPYAGVLAGLGEKERASRFLNGVMKANLQKREEKNFFEYHTAKRAKVELELTAPDGLDFYASVIIAKLVRSARSMVFVHSGKRKEDAFSDIGIRSLGVKQGDRIKVTSVGPDAVETLSAIGALVDPNTGEKFFRSGEITIKESTSGGAAYLGVSAAAYVIAHKAFFDKKVLFEKMAVTL